KGIRIWDPVAGKEMLSLPEVGGWSAIFADGKSVVGTYQGGGELQRWDLTTGKPLWPDERDLGHFAAVSRLAFDSVGRQMATLADDLPARVWDVKTGKLRHTMPLSGRNVNAAAFTVDGRYLFVGGEKELVQIDALIGQEVRRLPISQPERW